MDKLALRAATALAFISLTVSPANADVWTIGDDDGYGAGIADGAPHPFGPIYDGRSAAEVAATNGAQFTDTYSTTHPGYSPQAGTIATFSFTGLGSGWTQGAMIFDLADFQASTFGAALVSYNGFVQNWAFNDGYPNTAIHAFTLEQNVLDSINSLGTLTVTINRNNSGDFYGFDYAQLSNIDVNSAVPEPSTWAMMLLGFGAIGVSMRRRKRVTFAQVA